MTRDIVITGEGILCAIGNDKASVLASLKEGRTGIGEMRYLQSTHHELPVGEVKLSNEEMRASLGLPAEEPISRTILMGMIAVREALADAGVHNSPSKIRGGQGALTPVPPVINSPSKIRGGQGALTSSIQNSQFKILLISGTTVGGMDVTERCWREKMIPQPWDPGSTTKAIADYFGIFSDYTSISTACSSGANAILLGAELIKAGEADIVIAGGTEALSLFHLKGVNALKILDHDICRPFHPTRAGLNLGEGAAYMVLESEESALRRHAPIHARLTGYGNACDAFHQTASSENGDGAFLAMSEALSMAHLSPSSIHYINAHGTGTPNNDLSEKNAIERLFGKDTPPYFSTKQLTGHATSAAGAIEAVISIMQARLLMREEKPAEKGEAEGGGVNILTNSFGFGGNDTSLVFSVGCRREGCGVCDGIADSPTGLARLADSPTRLGGVAGTPTRQIRELSRVEIRSLAELEELRDYVKPMEARRMGKLQKSALLSSLKALRMAGIDTPDAIITGTAWGCIENSVHLLDQLKEDGEESFSPTLFMQSTHNTIGSSIAIRTRCHGYNITFSQGGRSLEWALRNARLLLQSGRCKTVLVGCHDETVPGLAEYLAERGVCDGIADSPTATITGTETGTGTEMVHSIAMVLSCGN